MKQIKVEKLLQPRWKETILQIGKGEMAVFEGTAEDGNKVRVAASELNKKNDCNYSVSIIGNEITVRNEINLEKEVVS